MTAFDQAAMRAREYEAAKKPKNWSDSGPMWRAAQADMDMHAGNDATKWREQSAKSYPDWELPPAGKQQNSADGK